MKIVIVGAQGVGKTTLANDLAEALKIDVLPEVARGMIEEGYELDKKVTEEIEYEILKRQVTLEQGTKGDYIADRCLIDLMAYVMILFGHAGDLIDAVNKELMKAKYNIIFYIEPEFEIEDDGVRSTDETFQSVLDAEIRLLLTDFNYHQVSGSPNERVEQALKIINKKYGK